MAESSQKPLENYGVAAVPCGVDGGANINKENCFFFLFPIFQNYICLGGGTFFFDNTQINSGKLSLYIKA